MIVKYQLHIKMLFSVYLYIIWHNKTYGYVVMICFVTNFIMGYIWIFDDGVI